jgi:hypothetical protein
MRRSYNKTGGGEGITSVNPVDPDTLEEQLRDHVAVMPIRGPHSSVTTSTGCTLFADSWENNSVAADSGHYTETLTGQPSVSGNIRVAPFATLGPNMSAPSTAVRPSQVIVADTGELIEIVNLSQQSNLSELSVSDVQIGDQYEEDDLDELPDPHSGRWNQNTIAPERQVSFAAPPRAATASAPPVLENTRQEVPLVRQTTTTTLPVLRASAPALQLEDDQEEDDPAVRNTAPPAVDVQRTNIRQRASTPTGPRRRSSGPTAQEK